MVDKRQISLNYFLQNGGRSLTMDTKSKDEQKYMYNYFVCSVTSYYSNMQMKKNL